MTPLSVCFVLAVPDADATARWWIDVMGFEPCGQPEGWSFVRRGACEVLLGSCPDAIHPRDLGDHSYFGWIEIDDVDAYHAEISARGAEVAIPPRDQEWGVREMLIRTPDGHRVMIGQRIRTAGTGA